MNVNEVIKYPILSEKTYRQMAEGVYTFVVDFKTNRAEVKKAVELIFDVKVSKINIISIDKQPTKLGKSEGFTNRIKKAIVKLAEGQINIFPEETANQVNEATHKDAPASIKDAKEPKVIEMSDVEKRAAAKIAAKGAKSKQDQEASTEVKDDQKTVTTKTNDDVTTTTKKTTDHDQVIDNNKKPKQK